MSSKNRVRTGPGNPGKSWNLIIANSRPGKCLIFKSNHWKSWKNKTSHWKLWNLKIFNKPGSLDNYFCGLRFIWNNLRHLRTETACFGFIQKTVSAPSIGKFLIVISRLFSSGLAWTTSCLFRMVSPRAPGKLIQWYMFIWFESG